MAPLSPFFSDRLFQNLNEVTHRFPVASVHHADFPVFDVSKTDSELQERMQLAQDVSSLVLSIRKKVNCKVRQPLQKILIPVLHPAMQARIEKVAELIKAEVNVKEIQYLTADNSFIQKKIKPNFEALGRKLGAKMKGLAAKLATFTQEDILKLEKQSGLTVQVEGEEITLLLSDVEITSEDIPGWMVANKGTLTVALDVTITPELEQEGQAREFVNRIQKIRKDNGYELTDKILVKVMGDKNFETAVSRFNTYICAEILAEKLDFVTSLNEGIDLEVNDNPVKVVVTKKA